MARALKVAKEGRRGPTARCQDPAQIMSGVPHRLSASAAKGVGRKPDSFAVRH